MKRKKGTIKKDIFLKAHYSRHEILTHFFPINFFMSIIFFSIKNTTLFMHNCARKIVQFMYITLDRIYIRIVSMKVVSKDLQARNSYIVRKSLYFHVLCSTILNELHSLRAE